MHLTTQEHGAYLLILISYYANASPPLVDDLPAIARLSPRDWVAIRPRIAKFFEEKDGKWYQKKADEILLESDSTHVARSQAGKKGNAIRWQSPSDRPAIPERSHPRSPGDRIPQPHLHERERGVERPSEQEVLLYADKIGLAPWKASDWWNEMETCNWLDFDHRPIIKWRNCLTRVKVKWEADGRPTSPPSNYRGKNGSSQAIPANETEDEKMARLIRESTGRK